MHQSKIDKGPPSAVSSRLTLIKKILMKQVTCILIVLLFSFFKSEGQITKGNWLLGGSASFSKTTYNSNG